jgi:Effector Associated Constant Component 1
MENPIDIELHLEGEDATEQVLFSLQSWIRNEGISSLESNIKQGQSQPDAMGVDPISFLAIVLSSTVLTELAKSISEWINSRKPKIKMILTVEGKSLEIEATNSPNIERQIERLLEMLPGKNQDSE